MKTEAQAGIQHHMLAELRRRYRGCKVGNKLKAKLADNWRRFKPSIPTITMGNVNALPNKIDELCALIYQQIYRKSSLFVFTETWLTHLIPHADADLLGFTVVRADRHIKACRKSKGGLIMYINNCWCNPGHVTLKKVLCYWDLELLAVSLRPYYLQRKYSRVITICVYIPPRADAATACEKSHTQSQLGCRCRTLSLSSLSLETFYCDYPTGNYRTIDLWYTNVKDAYRFKPLPPLVKSDHNLVYLQPQYTPLVQRQPVIMCSIRIQSTEIGRCSERLL